jgi:hypothetical protein
MDYVLIPGASGRAWYWRLVAPRLASRGHWAIAVELPADDDTKGLSDYAQAVLDAAGTAREVVIVAASLGAFTAPLVVEPLNATAVVLVNPMIPRPGETPGAWGAARASSRRARVTARVSAEFDPRTYMFHDVPPDVLATVTPEGEQSQRPMRDPSTFARWPAAVTVITGRDDRFFPVELQPELARTRLGSNPSSSRGAPGRAEPARRTHDRDPRRYGRLGTDLRSSLLCRLVALEHCCRHAACRPHRRHEPSGHQRDHRHDRADRGLCGCRQSPTVAGGGHALAQS